MPLPDLSNWDNTRTGLHQAAQVVGTFRKLLVPPQPNWLHLTLMPIPTGLTTGVLPDGGELMLDFAGRSINFQGEKPFSIALDGHTQVSLTDALISALKQSGYHGEPNRDKLIGTTPLEVDAALAEDYAWALHSVFVGVARFRARVYGWMSAAAVWPHGFDLSFLWFPEGHDESTDKHLNFGFSPGSAGLPRPYLYVYAHPIPAGMMDITLPPLAHWHTTGWTGVIIQYDDFAGESDTAALIEGVLTQTFRSLEPLMR